MDRQQHGQQWQSHQQQKVLRTWGGRVQISRLLRHLTCCPASHGQGRTQDPTPNAPVDEGGVSARVQRGHGVPDRRRLCRFGLKLRRVVPGGQHVVVCRALGVRADYIVVHVPARVHRNNLGGVYAMQQGQGDGRADRDGEGQAVVETRTAAPLHCRRGCSHGLPAYHGCKYKRTCWPVGMNSVVLLTGISGKMPARKLWALCTVRSSADEVKRVL